MPRGPLVGEKNVDIKEDVRPVLLLIPRLEALVLPISVERTNTKKPHAEYSVTPKQDEKSYSFGVNYIHRKTSTACFILDRDLKFTRFQVVKK